METPKREVGNGRPQDARTEMNYYGNTERMRSAGDEAATTNRIPTQRPRTGAERPAPRPMEGDRGGTTNRIPVQRREATGNTGRIPVQRPTGNTGRIPTQRGQAPVYGPEGRIPAQPTGNTGRIPTQRPAANAGRGPGPATRGQINRANPYGRTTKDEPDPNETGRLKIDARRRAAAQAQARANGAYGPEEDLGVSAENGFVERLATVPPKKLAAAGVIVTVFLVAVILLVLLIPRGNKGANNGAPAASFTPTPIFNATPTPTMNISVAPAATQHPCATPLQFGMQAPVVADIQQRLIDLGYMDYPVVDGVEQVTTSYGRVTREAVKIFQAKNGLTSDGWCGQGTYDLLMSEDAKPFFVKRGDKNDMVTKLQKRLKELGYFTSPVGDTAGPDTVNAIKAFQEKNGLQADGQAGAKTLEVLYSDAAIARDGKTVNMQGAAAPTPVPELTAPETQAAPDPEAVLGVPTFTVEDDGNIDPGIDEEYRG